MSISTENSQFQNQKKDFQGIEKLTELNLDITFTWILTKIYTLMKFYGEKIPISSLKFNIYFKVQSIYRFCKLNHVTHQIFIKILKNSRKFLNIHEFTSSLTVFKPPLTVVYRDDRDNLR